MPTTNTNRKILDLKRWEQTTPAPSATATGAFIASSRHFRQQQLYVASTTTAWLYNPSEDGFVQLPSPALAGSFGAGTSGCAGAFSLGNALASTTIAAGSNGAALPQATINVASTTGFPLAGAFFVDTADRGRQLITYTSVISGTQLGGCSGGAGTLATNQVVSFAGLAALSGTTSSIVTNQQLARDLRGYSLHVMSGPNAGATLEIQGNTTSTGSTTIAAGSNGVALPTGTINVASTTGFPTSGQALITISGAQVLVSYTGITATSFTGCTGGSGTLATSQAVHFASTITLPTQGSAFTTATVFRLMTPSWYVVGAGTLAAGSFRKYDFATNQWTSGTITGLPASLGTDGKLMSTPSWSDTAYKQFAAGTATSGSNTTLVQTGKTWAVNQWANYQVRIVGGTGAGQIRLIVSNTADTLTVSGWNTNPDTTSTYSIEGNDDFLYYAGNNAVTMYRYSIVSNAWTTLSPAVARAAAPGAGMSLEWIHSVSTSDWTSESANINGRRMYSFRGGAGSALDYYDIPSNTWVNAIGPTPATETFTTGTKWAYRGDFWYFQKDGTGRWFRYDFVRNAIEGWTTMLYPNGAAVVGDTAFTVSYFDGATEILYVYMILNSSAIMLRQMVI
ncbi:hypothetical protein LBMAG41_10850 [Cyanobium sp.]|nr:hypothetical protein LBMAG41_10850 [Cyanobium sp.]